MYVRYEQDENIPRETIKAQDLFLALAKERAETGRIYIMNIDHCNSHSSFTTPVYMSNLCQEITLPTKPINHIDDEKGEIALCILSAINVGKIRNVSELPTLCDISVRALDALIDYQGYPVKAAERATKARRSLGVGIIGLAHYLAKHEANYEDVKALELVHTLIEHFQYHLIDASCELAKEQGPCDDFIETKYYKGQLPIDHYKKRLTISLNRFMTLMELFVKRSKNMDYVTPHSPRRCPLSPRLLCVTQRMEWNPQETICRLRNRRKELLNKSFPLTPL